MEQHTHVAPPPYDDEIVALIRRYAERGVALEVRLAPFAPGQAAPVVAPPPPAEPKRLKFVMPDRPWLTIPEAAAYLGCNEATLRGYVREQKLTTLDRLGDGTQLVLERAQVERFKARHPRWSTKETTR